MLSTKEIKKMCKGTKITSWADLYKEKKTGQKAVKIGSAGEQCCEISQVANFCNTAKFHSFFFLFCIFDPNVF